MVGWALDAGLLTSIVPSLPAATFNTGLMFVASGIALAASRRRAIGFGCAAFVFALAGAHAARGGDGRRRRGRQPARHRLPRDDPPGSPLDAHRRGLHPARRLPAGPRLAHAARRLHRRGAGRRGRGLRGARRRGLPDRGRLPARPVHHTRHVGPHGRRPHLRPDRGLRAAAARAAGRLVCLLRAGRGRGPQPDGAGTGRAVRGGGTRPGGRIRRALQRALCALGHGRRGGGADPGHDPRRRARGARARRGPRPARAREPAEHPALRHADARGAGRHLRDRR